MKMRDYPLKPRGVLIPGNVEIIVRDNGKRVPKHCRHEHNIWVNLGREYLARVVAPNDLLTDHNVETGPSNREFIKYMGVGIGGDSQTHPSAYISPLSTDYPPADVSGVPGHPGNQFSDEDLTVQYLERPVKINEVTNQWMEAVSTPVVFLNSSMTLRLDHLFTITDINTACVPNYTIVPLSEVGLFLSTQDPDALNVYDPGAPNQVGAGRQRLLAYNTFEAIPKTVSFSLEIRWELRF
jgi:hypothetical protein